MRPGPLLGQAIDLRRKEADTFGIVGEGADIGLEAELTVQHREEIGRRCPDIKQALEMDGKLF